MKNHIKSICIQTWNNTTTVRFDRVTPSHGIPRKYASDSLICLERMIEEGKLTIKFVHYGNDGTSTLILEPAQSVEYFPITSVHRDDLMMRGYDTSSVDDSTMEHIAKRLRADYVEYGDFWEDLENAAEEWNLPKLDDEEDSDDEN